ncbi:hypothetical protein CL654_01820 [bacterium]|nr:hypothetical protein [bacterium]|tara:strand:- start:1429 stop:2865 length:1437 start_codon:yes stop_codon:yes gene_type:complete
MADLQELFEKKPDLKKKERDFIEKAYRFAQDAHGDQKRYSGELYFNHVVRSTINLLDFKVDKETIAAGLLHDVVEDCDVELSVIEKEFGKDVASLVSGVSKLGTVKYQGRERYVENMRHLFLSIADDVRILLIKLADRLDNVRTLEFVPKHKQGRIALETLEVYVPLANRLGMGKLRSELEEPAFKFAFPEDYAQVKTLITEKGREREKYIKKVFKSLSKQLVKAGVKDAHVGYRIKDTYSIYKKLLKKDMDVAKIYDLYALRVIVPKVEDCYQVLGIIHKLWKPLPGRIKDYIANPKINGYQSLHTTVFTGDGGIAEIQVRTEQMHTDAEYGVAAHLLYKGSLGNKKEERLKWLSHIREINEENTGSEDFLKNLKLDLFEKHVFLFTPLGDVIELPEGSTALDFAYAIHSDIGNHASGVRVNGKFVSLDTELNSGDIVEVQTKQNNKPTRKWLDYAKTSFAQRYIRNFLKQENKKEP